MKQVLPVNGRIALIDDQLTELIPLTKVFAKYRIPYNIYTGTPDELPDEPDEFSQVKIVFSDLDLTSRSSTDTKSIISTLIGILLRIIPQNSKFLLVLWSKHSDDKEYLDILNENLPIANIVPIKIIELNKFAYIERTGEGIYMPKGDCLASLVKELADQLDDVSILLPLIQYENLVHYATDNIVDRLCSFYEIDEKWDRKNRELIFAFAEAVVGKDVIQALSNEERFQKAILLINNILHDQIENLIVDHPITPITDIKPYQQDYKGIMPQIHSRVHIVQHPLNEKHYRGNVFEEENINDILRSGLKKDFKVEDCRKLLLDITPVCDYAQDKGYSRFIHGIEISAARLSAAISSNKKEYIIETPQFSMNDDTVVYIFDLRTIETKTKEEVENLNKPIFRFRNEYMINLQALMAHHIIRPGYITLY